MNDVYVITERPIPGALAGSLDFRDMTDVQRQNFHSRLKYIEEICLRSQGWIDSHEGFESTSDFIEYIELDLFVNLSLYEGNDSISPYRIHNSWTSETSPQVMADSLPSCFVDACVDVQIGFNCDEPEFLNWLKKRIACLETLLNSFYDADSLGQAVGCLIAVDICLSILLSGVSMQRLNRKFDRR